MRWMNRQTRNVFLERFHKPRGKIEIHHAELVSALKLGHAAQTRRVTIIVRNHDRWIERLKVQNEERPVVEGRERFHDKWHTFRSVLFTDLGLR